MAPPPPPPPMCFPFVKSKPKRLDFPDGSVYSHPHLTHAHSDSSSATLTTIAPSLAFHTDTEPYDDIVKEQEHAQSYHGSPEHAETRKPSLKRGNTMTGTKKSTFSAKLTRGLGGYGWGAGKTEKEIEANMRSSVTSSTQTLPLYAPQASKPASQHAPQPPVRRDSKSSHASKSTVRTQGTYDSYKSHGSYKSKDSQQTTRQAGRNTSSRSSTPKLRPPLTAQDSASTLVGSMLERKINDVESVKDQVVDTTARLADLRAEMAKNNLDFYIIPSEDAHGSEFIAASDKRREYITGFSGSAGQAVVTPTEAFLVTDSRYWTQAEKQIDDNWQLVRAGSSEKLKDWIDFLLPKLFKNARVGIDARMISHEKATFLNTKLVPLDAKFVFPTQNLVDLAWKDKPPKPRGVVYVQTIEYTGKDATYKLYKLREWIKAQPPSVPSYSRGDPGPSNMQIGTLISSLNCIAWILNLRGTDIPFNPLFHAYLFVGLDKSILFLDSSKVDESVTGYLERMNVERRNYTDVWSFLRKREWGEGKILIPPTTSYAISLMLSHFRYTIAPNRVESMMAIKNDAEISGMKNAYIRDGVAFVKFLAWLEDKLNAGYEITEWEAAWRIKEYRMKNKKFMGIAYETISATGPNAALPHYSPKKDTARVIDTHTPYLHDSGGQYRDGTCDTTRTLIFGRASSYMCEAYTRVLQGHIAIDTAVFPEGTSGFQLDALARKALWKDGLNYNHGTGHGFGAFLTVHEGDHSFSSTVPLQPGHVITNEPGFYLDGQWGIRIESALVVKRVKTRHEYNGDCWLGFERLTCVPIQTRMVKESWLTKEEKNWIKEHNQRCWETLNPYLKDDKVALKWLKREADRGIGVSTGPGGVSIEWD